MVNKLGELSLAKALLAVTLSCLTAWFLYSRFTFVQETPPGTKTVDPVAVERQLQQVKAEITQLRERLDMIERGLCQPPQPVPEQDTTAKGN